jgi:transposase
MLLSEGQMSDYKGAALMLSAMPKAKQLLADKGYDADWFRAALAKRRITPCIPSKANRKTAIKHLVLIVGVIIRREVEETPAFPEEQAKHATPTAPVREVLTSHSPDLLRVMGMAFMNVIPVVATSFGAAYAVQPGYGVQMDKTVYLWIPVVGNIVAVIVIPFVGSLSDRIGRRPPIIVGALGAGLLAFAYFMRSASRMSRSPSSCRF